MSRKANGQATKVPAQETEETRPEDEAVDEQGPQEDVKTDGNDPNPGGSSNATNEDSTNHSTNGGTSKRQSRLRSIESICTLNLPPRQWVHPDCKGILFEGFTLLAGPQEVGKSYLALNTMFYLADQCPDATFVYLALDDGDQRVSSRANKLLAGRAMPSNVKMVTASDNWPRMAWPTLPGDGLHELIAELEELANPRLVVIDTLSLFMPSSSRNLSYDEEYARMAEIRKVTDIFPNLSILATTHITKGEYKDPFDAIYGTRGKGAASDVQMLMVRDQSPGRAILKLRGNDLSECVTTLIWNAKELIWERGPTTAEGEEGFEEANQQFQASAQTQAEVNSSSSKPGSKPDKLIAAIRDATALLRKRPLTPSQFMKAMEKLKHSKYAVRAAKETLGLKAQDGVYSFAA